MSRCVVTIDQGTTGTTVLVVDAGLQVLSKVNREHPQIYPQPGWVEHDPEALWESTRDTLARSVAASVVSPEDIAAVGITNQRETTLLWERSTGKVLYNAIVWQDRRTSERCAELKTQGHEALFRARTGLVVDPYFSGTKLAWLLDQDPSLRRRAERGELAFGTVDTFLLFRLTGGQSHFTDVSNASRTLMFDLHHLRWDDELLAILGVPRAVLPEVRGNAELFGHVRGVEGIPDGTPVTGMAGDQQSALFGQLCFGPGDAKCTYGTGAFLLMNTGTAAVPSTRGLLTTVAWQLGGKTKYALEGSAFIAGAAVQWLRDGLHLIDSAAAIEPLAAEVPDSGGVVFVPALTGLGAPHWNPEARGVITGITRGTTRAHLARATLEAIALQNLDILSAMRTDSGQPLNQLKVDGGASANDLLMQFQADILGVPVTRPQVLETTAMGAAMLAGLAGGVWPDDAALRAAWRVDREFHPQMPAAEVAAHRARWDKAVGKA